MNRNNNRGFSLVELLIVVAIIAILAAFAVPSLIGNKQAAREQVVKSKLAAIGSAESTFRTLLAKRRYASLSELQTTLAGGSPLLTSADVTVTGWTISEVASSVTSTTFGISAVPTADNTRDASYVVFEDGVVRQCPRGGPWTRSCQAVSQ